MDQKLKYALIILGVICGCFIFLGVGIGILVWYIIESQPPPCCEELIIPGSFSLNERLGNILLEIVELESDKIYGYLRRRSFVWTRTVDFYGPNKKAALEAHWAFWSFGDDVTLYHPNNTETAIAQLQEQVRYFQLPQFYLLNGAKEHIATLKKKSLISYDYIVHHPTNDSLVYATISYPLFKFGVKWEANIDMQASTNAGIDPRVYPFMVAVLEYRDSDD